MVSYKFNFLTQSLLALAHFVYLLTKTTSAMRFLYIEEVRILNDLLS